MLKKIITILFKQSVVYNILIGEGVILVPNITNTLGNVSNSFSQNESPRRTSSSHAQTILRVNPNSSPSLAERDVNHSLNDSEYLTLLALAILAIESRPNDELFQHSEEMAVVDADTTSSVSSSSEDSEVSIPSPTDWPEYDPDNITNAADWPELDASSVLEMDYDYDATPSHIPASFEPSSPPLTESPIREILPEGATCTMMCTEIPAEYGILINNDPFDVRYFVKGMLTQDLLSNPYTRSPFNSEDLEKICKYIGCSQTQFAGIWGWSFFDTRRSELCSLLDRSLFHGKNTQKFVNGFTKVLFEGS